MIKVGNGGREGDNREKKIDIYNFVLFLIIKYYVIIDIVLFLISEWFMYEYSVLLTQSK